MQLERAFFHDGDKILAPRRVEESAKVLTNEEDSSVNE
jgi:hypothetical protein